MEHIASRRRFLKTAACRVGNLLTLPSDEADKVDRDAIR
jgi:hypothetical protein